MASLTTLSRWLAPAAVAGVALATAACTPGGQPKSGGSATAAPVNVGAPLYAADPAPTPPRPDPRPEPIVVPQATLQFDEKISLAFQVDGDLELVASPLDPKGKYDPKDPQYAGRLVPRPRDKSWMYVRLVEDQPIKENQVLAQLDDSQVTLQLQSLKDSLAAAKNAADEGDSSVKEAAEALKLTERSGGTAMELIRYRVELSQTKVSQARTKVEMVRYQGEYSITGDKWQRHKIFSPFNGKVVRILKSPGEYVKAGDPVIEVQNTSRFRVEGKLDRQEAGRLKQYVPVTVEPVRSVGPEPYTARHRQEVTGITVTAHPGRPLVVSASNDGTALVWDVTAAEKGQHVLPHPAGTGVRCVTAVGKADGPHLVATGGSDGKVRLWDVTDPARLPDKPTAEFEDSHAAAVTAAAFTPDGRFLATAAGREVILWDVAARKKRYAFPGEHKDDVKAMRFTPQATLVTVCRDKAVRVWTVGADGATARTLDHRSGAVDVLGVSADGGRVLFDQDASRIDVVNLADGRTTGSLMNTGGGLRFAGLALFSPDDKFVVTGAGDADTKGELQLWAVPAGGRGSERRRLVTQYRAAVTAAAFSPDPAHRFVAVGTQSGVIHFWNLPDPNEQSVLKGRVISVLPNDARTAQVRVEVENADGKLTDQLQDRGAATIIIDPSAKPEPPALPAAPPQPLPNIQGAGAVRPLSVGPLPSNPGVVVPAGGVAGK
jgi:WD40 repeat protein